MGGHDLEEVGISQVFLGDEFAIGGSLLRRTSCGFRPARRSKSFNPSGESGSLM